MIRDAQRIDHMLDFVRRSIQILDGVDFETYMNPAILFETVATQFKGLERHLDDLQGEYPL